jgi:peptidoglycan/LPS O-acetylase OafA/YrhL
MTVSSASYKDSKHHFLILDALRGVASLVVVMMHLFEVHCAGDFHKLIVGHGYLAVDFFFMLSGYVMAHAYDDRWDKMTVVDFFKRRLIRLHPLIILGMTIGALLFYSQTSSLFPKIADTTVEQLLAVMLVGYMLIPLPPSMDIRGWAEMHPLNGATWSLFFEYIANVLHVLILRKLPNLMLSALVFLAAMALCYVAIKGPSGDVIGGWAFDAQQLKIGFVRLLYPYMAGMLLRRVVKVGAAKNTFLLTSAILVTVLAWPRVGGYDTIWLNGLYESVVIIAVFPLIIYLGAIGEARGAFAQKVCTFLGDLSYPLYITHFPFVYTYSAWVVNNKISVTSSLPVIMLLFVWVIVVAYAALKWYDIPVRKWLTKRFLQGH